MRRFLLIPHLKIQNANAMSSPYSIGFPAMTAWLGAVHALQRFLNQHGFESVSFSKVAISCHDFELQTYKGDRDFVHSIIGTANPSIKKEGAERPAFIEEPRCHLEVSILIEYHGLEDNVEKFENAINMRIACMKWASGDMLAVKPVSAGEYIDEDNEQETKQVLRKLMLGHVIIERRDLMIKAMQNEGKDALEALLDHLKVMHRATKAGEDEKTEAVWTSKRKEAGWIVPIAVGFQGISLVGAAKNQRDAHTPHCFAESVITLGEFVMPYRIANIDDILWRYHVDLEKSLYLCCNQALELTNNL